MSRVELALSAALGGVRDATTRFEKAAETLARPLTIEDSVRVGGQAPPDYAGATVDLRVQKYVFVANLRVAQAALELRDELNAIGKK